MVSSYFRPQKVQCEKFCMVHLNQNALVGITSCVNLYIKPLTSGSLNLLAIAVKASLKSISIFINNSGSNKMIFQQHIVHRFICQFVDIYKLVRFYESIKEPLCKIIICRAIFQWMKAHIRCIIPHPVASEHRWLVKAPRWIHSVPDVSDRRSWRCGCQARL